MTGLKMPWSKQVRKTYCRYKLMLRSLEQRLVRLYLYFTQWIISRAVETSFTGDADCVQCEGHRVVVAVDMLAWRMLNFCCAKRVPEYRLVRWVFTGTFTTGFSTYITEELYGSGSACQCGGLCRLGCAALGNAKVREALSNWSTAESIIKCLLPRAEP